jgi:hypothetical protein
LDGIQEGKGVAFEKEKILHQGRFEDGVLVQKMEIDDLTIVNEILIMSHENIDATNKDLLKRFFRNYIQCNIFWIISVIT